MNLFLRSFVPSANSRRTVVGNWRKYKHKYSITSMARTRTVRLPWMIRTLFFSPYKILPVAQENKHLVIIFLFYDGIVCCVY